MSLNLANLSFVGVFGPGGPLRCKVFNYTTGDDKSDVDDSAYWNGSGAYLHPGDMVQVTANDGNIMLRVEDVTSVSSVSISTFVADVGTFAF